MKKDNIFREYWYLWVVVILLPIALYCVIHQPWGFDAIGRDEAPKVWLGFWGGYLGAIISASVAFFILDKQIKANKEENKKIRELNKEQNETNRTANEKQNKENREAQRKAIEYQQRQQWLNDFKKVASEYIAVFNNNNLVVAQNNLFKDAQQAYNDTKAVLDNLQITKAKMELFKNHDEYATDLYANLLVCYDKFSSVVIDIHRLSAIIGHYDNRNLDSDIILQKQYLIYIKDPQNGYSKGIIDLIPPQKSGLLGIDIIYLAQQRRESVTNILKEVSTLLVSYTTEEQKRINDILQERYEHTI